MLSLLKFSLRYRIQSIFFSGLLFGVLSFSTSSMVDELVGKIVAFPASLLVNNDEMTVRSYFKNSLWLFAWLG